MFRICYKTWCCCNRICCFWCEFKFEMIIIHFTNIANMTVAGLIIVDKSITTGLKLIFDEKWKFRKRIACEMNGRWALKQTFISNNLTKINTFIHHFFKFLIMKIIFIIIVVIWNKFIGIFQKFNSLFRKFPTQRQVLMLECFFIMRYW